MNYKFKAFALVAGGLMLQGVAFGNHSWKSHRNNDDKLQGGRSSLAYPTAGQWHASFGVDTGVDSYKTMYQCHTQNQTVEGSAYALGLNQSVGYGCWFYLQAKESGSIAIATSDIANPTAGQERRSMPRFFDADIRAYFPLSVSQDYRVSVQPQIGFAVHYNIIRSHGATASTIDDVYTSYRSRALAPLAGLAVGYEASSNFNFRLGVAFEILNMRQRSASGPTADPTAWVNLKMRRAAVHSTLDMSYRAGSNVDFTGSVDHLNYCISNGADVTDTDFSFFNRLSYKAGVRWSF